MMIIILIPIPAPQAPSLWYTRQVIMINNIQYIVLCGFACGGSIFRLPDHICGGSIFRLPDYICGGSIFRLPDYMLHCWHKPKFKLS